MKRRDFLGFALSAGASAAWLRGATRTEAAPKFDFARLRPQIDEKVPAYMGANGVPGVAIGVAYREPGGPLQEEYFHYGVANKSTNAPMDESTVALTNSVTKVITSSMLALNVARGTMSVSDPLQKYLPDTLVPKFGETEITLEHLATHRSGLQRDAMASNQQVAGYLNVLSNVELKRAPGETYEYSNFGFALLGMALSNAASVAYDKLVADEILGPLGMSDSGFFLSDEQKTRFAQGYRADGQPFNLRPFSAVAPAGLMLSTTPDLMKFLKANLDVESSSLADGFKVAQKQYAMSNATRASGLGWEIDRPGPTQTVWKNGGDSGTTSLVWFARNLGYGVVILANRGIALQGNLPVAGSSPADALAFQAVLPILTGAATGR